jgi:PAS domain S-box-containing protein
MPSPSFYVNHWEPGKPSVHNQSPETASSPGSDELLRLMVDSATDYAIFSIDPGGIVTSWNSGAERLLGYTEAEILGHSADVLFPPEEGGSAAAEQERHQALQTGRAEDERWQMRRDGSLFWASGLLMPLVEPGAGFVKILHDRTQHHLAETRLRESEARFRLLAQNIPQLVFLCRPDGMRTWGSPQWIEFTGLSLGESVGFGWLDAIHPDDLDATRAGWTEAHRFGEYYAEHRVRRAADGEYRWHQTRARPVDPTSHDTHDWVGTMTDIHDLRGMHDRQQVLLAELQHRTRNLLAVIHAIAGQTLRNSPSLNEFGPQFEGRLRALSRVQAMLSRVDNTSIGLRELVLAELSAHGGAPGEGPSAVEGPEVALPPSAAQAFALALHELATNAVKYGALSQPTGRLSVTWRVEPGPRDQVVLDWQEHGVRYPDAVAPTRRGYGSMLIERALPAQLNAQTRLEFAADGVRCRIVAPLAAED